MENISYIENGNSIVILPNKSIFDHKTIDMAKRFFFLQSNDLSHIPFVSNSEQKEIEILLKNPDCNIFVDKNLINKGL